MCANAVPMLPLIICAAFLCVDWCNASLTQRRTSASSAHICPPDELKGLRQRKFTEYQSLNFFEDLDSLHRKTLQALYDHPLLLSRSSLQKSVSNFGDGRKLERFMHKLTTERSTKVVALGGSITAGMGVHRPENAYVERVFHWINSTFPHAAHEFINLGLPAGTTKYVAPCIQQLVPPDTDLVLLEFTINDHVQEQNSSVLDDPPGMRRALERVVRKLMRLPGRPAVLYVQLFHPYLPFPSNEDSIEVVLKYYGLPSLSLRDAVSDELVQDPALRQELWPPEFSLHPTCIGARCGATASHVCGARNAVAWFIADMIVGRLQDVAADVLRFGGGEEPHPEVLQEDVKAPLFQGNFGNETAMCLVDNDFRTLAMWTEGWEWVDEVCILQMSALEHIIIMQDCSKWQCMQGKLPSKPKWGWVSTTPETQLLLRVPLEEAGIHGKTKVLVALGLLQSYEHMGVARMQCASNCSCLPIEADGHMSYRFSLPYWHHVTVSSNGMGPCVLVVTVLKRTNSGEHKVKATALMVSADKAALEASLNPIAHPQISRTRCPCNK